jgi:hypothetical protein
MADRKLVEGRERYEIGDGAKTRTGVKDLGVTLVWGKGRKVESVSVDHRVLTRKGIESLMLLVKHREEKRG